MPIPSNNTKFEPGKLYACLDKNGTILWHAETGLSTIFKRNAIFIYLGPEPGLHPWGALLGAVDDVAHIFLAPNGQRYVLQYWEILDTRFVLVTAPPE